jgi:hypothetical protein
MGHFLQTLEEGGEIAAPDNHRDYSQRNRSLRISSQAFVLFTVGPIR